MSRAAQKLISASGGKAYEIEQSLAIESGNPSFLYRQNTADGNKKTFTISFWIKRFQTGKYTAVFGAGSATGSSGGGVESVFVINTDDTWGLSLNGNVNNAFAGDDVLRDTSAWYHLIGVLDTTQATESNRFKLYKNGVEVSSYSEANTHLSGGGFPYQNFETVQLNGDDKYHQISGLPGYDGTDYRIDGYLAEFNFIDGTACSPSDFGEFDSVTGQWIPKKYEGSYGTNGIYMKFVEDGSSGAIGTDSSGNNNNYTLSHLSDYFIYKDTPTNNFCTYNYVDRHADVAPMILSYGGLRAYKTSSTGYWSRQTFPIEGGKWYVEFLLEARTSGNVSIQINHGATWSSYYFNSGDFYLNGSSHSVIAAASNGDIIGIALNVDDSEISIYKNGSSILSATSFTNDGSVAADTAGNTMIGVFHATNDSTVTVVNFGQNSSFMGNATGYANKTKQNNTDGNGIGDFYYSPPSGFLALCTKNLPTPTIKKPSEHFNTILYTGNDADDRTLTGVGFQPDLVWLKTRNAANWHQLHDVLRGAGNVLYSNETNSEYTSDDDFKAFTSDGFTVDDDAADINASEHTYVAWNWKAGGSGSSNTDGAQTTTVSANTTAGFSIVTWTGTGSATTFGHGLGAVPKVYIMKRRDSANYWWIGTTTIDGSHDFGELDTAVAFGASSLTAPTSSVFYSDGTQNTSSATYVAYVFAEVPGFSKFGSYTGNGSTLGPLIHTGFKPAMVMIHTTAGGTSWIMLDNKRDPHNPAGHYLLPDLPNAESDFNRIDFLSNGFKLRQSYTGDNANNVVYFYMAFAEAPFKYANAR